jgi:hypothetical protein
VIAPEEYVSIQPLKVLDGFFTVLHIHRNIAEMNEGILGVDNLIMAVQELVVHLSRGTERSPSVFDNIGMPKVMIRDYIPSHEIRFQSVSENLYDLEIRRN